PLKKARRAVRKAAHPVRTGARGLTPKPVRRGKRVAWKMTNPLEATEQGLENSVVRAVRGRSRRKTRRTVALPRKPRKKQKPSPPWLGALILIFFALGVA